MNEEKMEQTITITFGDQAENHVGMQKLGKLADTGFTLEDLKETQKRFEGLCETEFVDLGQSAYVLVIKNGCKIVSGKSANKMYREQRKLEPDKKALMRGKVKNKLARWNLCFGSATQEPDYEHGKGRIVSYDDVPRLSRLRNNLGEFFGPKAESLWGEGNYYYDPKKCMIGFHGDSERRRVIALRLGADFPLYFHWFLQSKPIGNLITINLRHGDMYMMSEKAVGFDWKKRSISTLRHAAGEKALVELKKKIQKK